MTKGNQCHSQYGRSENKKSKKQKPQQNCRGFHATYFKLSPKYTVTSSAKVWWERGREPINEKARIRIADNELLNLFDKTQQLPDDQKKTVIDLLSAFLLKSNLKQQLT